MSSAERYRSGDLVSQPAGQGHILVQSALTGSAALLTAQQAALLRACTFFRSLDGHAKATRAKRAELESLARQGLLTSETALRQRCFGAVQQPVTAPSISTVAVITRERIDSLQRCLESYIDDGQRADRRVEYLVIDTAPQAEARDLTRAMLRGVSTRRDVTVRYAGLEERQRFANALERAGLPRPAIDFALFDPEGCDLVYGAARNTVLLATAGQLVLCADDDTVCSLAEVPGAARDGLALSSQNDPTSLWFFPNHEAALASTRHLDRSVLAIHEDLLGRDVASCLEFAPKPDLLRVDDIDGPFLRALESGRARVAVTSTGMLGDAGSGLPPAIRLLDAESRQRLVGSEAAYRTLARSRQVHRGVIRQTISKNPYLMMTGAAIDNRAILPPFFPVLRGEDTIFGFMLGACVEGATIGHLPFTLLHSPGELREIAPDAINDFARHPSSFELVIGCVQSFSALAGTSPAERLRALGRQLGAIASLAPADFEEFLRLWVWRMKALAMERLTNDLEASSATSASWKQDVQRYLESLRTSFAADAYLVPPDLKARFGGGALPVMQRLIARFGDLLQCWPAMLEVARSRAAGGEELARPLRAG
ncbi:MAG: hypothetical protein M3077_08640 [Candidatus Dormibacteraeota bacterium]|nr:hypothetical protein [Candidatus Dormibacteraeota bacterium]